MPKKKVVLAYSGGLDTSVAIKWIAETYNMDVVTLTVDIGNVKNMKEIQARALKVGAIKAVVQEASADFIKYFVWPALQANAMYQGQYPLATALGRPLIAKLLVDVARQEKASAVAHGCTGKGNDQVRFDVSVNAMAPDLQIIAPAREWHMSRDEEMDYAKKHNIPVPTTKRSPFSTDENLWGRSIESGVLEDPWAEPPPEVYQWTRSPADAPDKPAYVEIEFASGVPVAIDGKHMESVALVKHMHQLAGMHGVGRIDHIEDRLVGIKSREVYESPAATVLIQAHKALENMVLSKEQIRFKDRLANEYAEMVYNGLWFTSHHQDLAAYVQSTQRHVNGTVRMKLHKGTSSVVGRKSDESLYNYQLATYDKADTFDASASVGFIRIWGLPVQNQARTQLLKGRQSMPLALTEGDKEKGKKKD